MLKRAILHPRGRLRISKRYCMGLLPPVLTVRVSGRIHRHRLHHRSCRQCMRARLLLLDQIRANPSPSQRQTQNATRDPQPTGSLCLASGTFWRIARTGRYGSTLGVRSPARCAGPHRLCKAQIARRRQLIAAA
ncbi:hypothetical protein PYCCODRAFT_1133788 [Trametes coccinea BRFM310]|uniref:Uncharacterized protein n=1 Tax=Trametes coccinea (strain BRFM310) TaxID=1353009 RepID=A0A1Y2I9Y1_TRAC3|nr:hypothetical protein PYCCODRAFT_1133788 [Trametes coccinea BRFM310]